MPAGDERIAPTAHFTAYVWHRLGLPHAELFATPQGAALFWSFYPLGHGVLPRLAANAPTISQYLELRHRWIDGALEEEDPDVVVELGAGLSRRGVTYAARGVRYVEIDLAPMVALKTRLIARRASAELRDRLSAHLELCVADVTSDALERTLQRALDGARRPVVIAEGLLGYLDADTRERLVAVVARALRGRGAALLELRSAADDAGIGPAVKVVKAAIGLATRGRGAQRELAGPAEVRRSFAEAGFDRVELLAQDRVPALSHLRSPTRVWRVRS